MTTKRIVEVKPPNGGQGEVVIGYVGPLEGWLALLATLRSKGYECAVEIVGDQQ